MIQVHPLVIMNCADHCNRAKYIQTEDSPKLQRVFGAILGNQHGKVIEIRNSIEIIYDLKNGKIDEPFLKRRLAAYKKMFPHLDCLGWYSSGSLSSD